MKKRYWALLVLLFLIQPVIYIDNHLSFHPAENSSAKGRCEFQQDEKPALGILLINFRPASDKYFMACMIRLTGEHDMEARFINLDLIGKNAVKTNLVPERHRILKTNVD